MTHQFTILNDFYDKIVSDEIFKDSAFEGCTNQEVLYAEKLLNYSLPLSIKEFLLFCGKQWKGTYVLESTYSILVSQKPYEIVSNIIKETDDTKLKALDVQTIIIIDFGEHLGDYYFSFFYKNENDNPQIYNITYDEINDDNLSFTNYIMQRLNNSIKFSQTLFLNRFEEIELKLSYINANAVKRVSLQDILIINEIYQILPKFPQIEELTCPHINSTANSQNKLNIEVPFISTLKKIDITRDELVFLKLPKEGLPNLKEVLISSQNFIGIPENLSKCKNLEILALKEYNIFVFPTEIFELKNLIHLVMTKLHMEEVPKGLKGLTHLRKITLIGNIINFPEELFLLDNLEYINFSSNILNQIDDKICKLKELKKLDISENSFTNEAITKLKLLLPNVEIISWNQKPYQKPFSNARNFRSK